MKARLGKYGLDANPHSVSESAWFYEGMKGIDVLIQGERSEPYQVIIPRRSIEAYMRRLSGQPAPRRGNTK